MKVTVALAIVALAAMAPQPSRASGCPEFIEGQAPCTESLPPGFRAFEAIDWAGPWVVDARTAKPLPSVERHDTPLPIRFDDGSQGSVRVTAFPCPAGQKCPPDNSGSFGYDRSRIDVMDAAGVVVTSREVWLPYSRVSLVAVDLVSGAGDELVIVRIPGRSSPASGHQMKIWRLDRPAPVDLIQDAVMLAQGFATTPVSCARWQGRLAVDASTAKPRAIAIRHELGSHGCCQIFADEDRPSVDALRQERRLEFDTASLRYVDSLGRR